MKIVIQRSKNSSVSVNETKVGEIDFGFVVLVGFKTDDTEQDIDYIVNKLINVRLFDDEDGVMNKSILDVNGQILSISQFTLYADSKKGRRPSYIAAMRPLEAERMYDLFNKKIKDNGIKLEKGIFGADMLVNINNDGPVTIIMESEL